LRSIPPKSSDTCILGQKAKNTTHEWYIKGGTFCSRCRIKFTFEETLRLLLRDKELGRTHGIPRCWNCGQSLRTRSKSCDCDGFWEEFKRRNLYDSFVKGKRVVDLSNQLFVTNDVLGGEKRI